MKRWYVAAICFLPLLLSGCRQPVRLTDRAVVKMICVCGQAPEYQVRLVAYTAAEDAQEDSEKETLLIEGTGETVKTALLNAQEQLREQLFYAQNELLLIEESTAASGLREILLFFSEERSSRPNMAVFGYSAPQEELLLDPEGAETVINSLEKMKDGNGPVSCLTQMIYRFDLTGRTQDFFLLPRLSAEKEKNIETDAILIFQEGEGPLVLSGEEKQLAEILLGAADRFQYDAGEESCTVSNPHVTMQVERNGNPELTVSFSGEIKDLSLQNDPDQMEEKVSSRLSEVFSRLYTRCYLERGVDPFRFGWDFLQWDAAAYEQKIEQKTLFGPATVRFEPQITAVA